MFEFAPGCSVKLTLNKTAGEHGEEVRRGRCQNIPDEIRDIILTLSSLSLSLSLSDSPVSFHWTPLPPTLRAEELDVAEVVV